jgi:hypothetical protein
MEDRESRFSILYPPSSTIFASRGAAAGSRIEDGEWRIAFRFSILDPLSSILDHRVCYFLTTYQLF